MAELATMISGPQVIMGPGGWETTVTPAADSVATSASNAAMMEAIGTGLKAGAQVSAGMAANTAAKFEAGQLKTRASEERAASQREVSERRRKTGIVMSRQKALAASSGAGVTNASILDLIGDTAQHGEFLAQADMAIGESRARGLEDQAAAARFRGKNALSGSILEGVTTGITGLAKMRKTFG